MKPKAKKTSTSPRKSSAKKSSSKKTSARKKTAGSAKRTHESSPIYNADQISQLLNKSLNLAEAGIGLGVTLVTRLGSLVKEQAIDKIIPDKLDIMGLSSHNDQQGEPSSETTSPGTAEGGQPELTHLVNRLPISPGDKLSLSFSINNDSTEKTRKVKLKLEGFMGQNNQFMFIGRDFSLSPSKKEIAPADFDKFIISGEIPFDTPPDIYYGVVHITGDHELKIPVVLNITEKA